MVGSGVGVWFGLELCFGGFGAGFWLGLVLVVGWVWSLFLVGLVGSGAGSGQKGLRRYVLLINLITDFGAKHVW